MSTDQQDFDVLVDLEDDSARAVVTERREHEFEPLFVDGELRLWEDDVGWNGFVREEESDGAVVYYYVNSRFDGRWHQKIRVGEQAVRDAVRRHIEDPAAGRAGEFNRGCSPP